MDEGVQVERHISVGDLIGNFGKTPFLTQNRILGPIGKIQMFPALSHVALNKPRYWRDIAVPGIAGLFRMAVPAASIDDAQDLAIDSGTLEQLPPGARRGLRPARE
jgi:hypothetical protein